MYMYEKQIVKSCSYMVMHGYMYICHYGWLYPWLSVVIGGYAWLSMVMHGYMWLSMVICGYMWLSMVVTCCVGVSKGPPGLYIRYDCQSVQYLGQ